MKANEAPEKVYCTPTEGGFYLTTIKPEPPFVEGVEYIRKDAFIEKVLDYIENNIYDHYDGDNEYGICGGYVKKEEFIKNLKDYMKGE